MDDIKQSEIADETQEPVECDTQQPPEISENESLKLAIGELKQQLTDTVTAAEKEAEKAKELQNSFLRLQADFDNYRKRTAQQIDRIRGDSVADVIVKIIPILDVVQQALQMITDEKVATGIGMIETQISDTLKGFGVTEIAALGKPFDPNYHNAMMQVKVSNPDQEGMVVEVFQKGYQIGDKILRHSVVKVGS